VRERCIPVPVSRLRKSSTNSLQARTSPENERAMTSAPRLEVASKCGNCGTEATTPLSLQEAGRCSFEDPD
jgi:hypothetical protein